MMIAEKKVILSKNQRNTPFLPFNHLYPCKMLLYGKHFLTFPFPQGDVVPILQHF